MLTCHGILQTPVLKNKKYLFNSVINTGVLIYFITTVLLSFIIHTLLIKMFNMVVQDNSAHIRIIINLTLITTSIFLPTLLLLLSITIYNNANIIAYTNVPAKILLISNAYALCAFVLALASVYLINKYIIKSDKVIIDFCFRKSHAKNNNYIVYFAWFMYTYLVVFASLFILLSKYNIHYAFCSLFLTILHGIFIFGLL